MLEETARPLNRILLTVKMPRAAYVNLLDQVTAVLGDLQPQRIIFTQGTKPSVALFFLACVFSILGTMCVKNYVRFASLYCILTSYKKLKSFICFTFHVIY